MSDEAWMAEALHEAELAASEGEIPVGCVIVRDGQLVARGHNLREQTGDPTAHAEVVAIRRAAQALGCWKLSGCTMYVTLEPCPMCAGAILNARIPRVVYGARAEKYGACRSVCSLFDMNFNHHPVVEGGVLEQACAELMQEFFRELRVQLRSRPKWRRPE